MYKKRPHIIKQFKFYKNKIYSCRSNSQINDKKKLKNYPLTEIITINSDFKVLKCRKLIPYGGKPCYLQLDIVFRVKFKL